VTGGIFREQKSLCAGGGAASPLSLPFESAAGETMCTPAEYLLMCIEWRRHSEWRRRAMTRHSQLLLLQLLQLVVAAVPHLHQSISASTVCTEGPASTHNTVVRCQCDCERTSERLETVSMHGELNSDTTLAYVNVSLTSLGQYILSRSDRRRERSETIIIIIIRNSKKSPRRQTSSDEFSLIL